MGPGLNCEINHRWNDDWWYSENSLFQNDEEEEVRNIARGEEWDHGSFTSSDEDQNIPEEIDDRHHKESDQTHIDAEHQIIRWSVSESDRIQLEHAKSMSNANFYTNPTTFEDWPELYNHIKSREILSLTSFPVEIQDQINLMIKIVLASKDVRNSRGIYECNEPFKITNGIANTNRRSVI